MINFFKKLFGFKAEPAYKPLNQTTTKPEPKPETKTETTEPEKVRWCKTNKGFVVDDRIKKIKNTETGKKEKVLQYKLDDGIWYNASDCKITNPTGNEIKETNIARYRKEKGKHFIRHTFNNEVSVAT